MQRRLAISILGALAILFLYQYFDLGSVFSLDGVKENRNALLNMVNEMPYISAGVFVAVYVIVVVASVPVATVFTLLGGFLFGAFWGTILVVLSATMGSVITFLIARWFFHDWFFEKFNGRITRIIDSFKNDAFTHLLVLRLVPLFPFFMLNIAPAFTNIPVRQFFFATALGIIPGSFVYVYAGQELGSIESVKDIASGEVIGAFVLLAVLALVPYVYKKVSGTTVSTENTTEHDTM